MKKYPKAIRSKKRRIVLSSSSITPTESPQMPNHKTLSEWLNFAVSLGIIGGLISSVGILWSSAGDAKPPRPTIHIEREKISTESGYFYVPFKVKNEGDETAAQVQIIGELKRNGMIEQSGEQSINFLARHETEKGVFIFQSDPREGELSIRVTSYQEP